MMTGRPTLTAVDMQLLDGLAAGENTQRMAKRTGLKVTTVKQRIHRLCSICDLDIEQPQRNWRVMLAQWWKSPLFRIGLEELGLLPGKEAKAA